MTGRILAVTTIFLSLLFLSSPAMAGEWVPAGADQPGFRITDVTVSGDGAYGALTGDAGIILLNADGVERWRIPEGSYSSVSLSGDGKILVAGGDGILVLHQDSTVLATIRSRNYVNDVAISADGSRIVAAIDDETLRIYNVTGTLVRSTETGDDLVSVAISPDGAYIAGGTDTGNVLLFSSTGDERWTYGLSRKPVTAVAMAEGARTIAAVSEDGVVVLLSRAGGLLWSGSAPHAGGVSVTSDGDGVAVADRQGVRFIERDGTPAGLIPGVDASVSTAMDSDGTLIAVTNGARVSGFIQETVAAPEEMGRQSETRENTDNSSVTVLTPTLAETLPPEGGIPVSTQSSFPLVPAITGLILGAGFTAAGRRFRE